jgi:hypothetical protein
MKTFNLTDKNIMNKLTKQILTLNIYLLVSPIIAYIMAALSKSYLVQLFQNLINFKIKGYKYVL